jgi:hypothetical protein
VSSHIQLNFIVSNPSPVGVLSGTEKSWIAELAENFTKQDALVSRTLSCLNELEKGLRESLSKGLLIARSVFDAFLGERDQGSESVLCLGFKKG